MEPACEPTDGFVGHIDGRELGVVGFVGRGVGVATGFLLAEFPSQTEALGKVTLPFDAPAEGKFMGEDADGRDLEYFDALGEDAVGVGADTGARGFFIPLVGRPGVDGKSEGFDLLYFDGAVAEGVPLPE